MKVFVAGATGVLGHRTVARLVAAGADVTGLARSSEGACRIDGLGARAAQVSLFDREQLAAVVAGHDVVVNLATSIPTGERAGSPEAWQENHRIRREGSRNLVDAALAAGASKYLQESIALLYADGGDEWLGEWSPAASGATTSSALEAEPRRAGSPSEAGPASCCGSASCTATTAATPSRRSRRRGPAARSSWGQSAPGGRW